MTENNNTNQNRLSIIDSDPDTFIVEITEKGIITFKTKTLPTYNLSKQTNFFT